MFIDLYQLKFNVPPLQFRQRGFSAGYLLFCQFSLYICICIYILDRSIQCKYIYILSTLYMYVYIYDIYIYKYPTTLQCKDLGARVVTTLWLFYGWSTVSVWIRQNCEEQRISSKQKDAFLFCRVLVSSGIYIGSFPFWWSCYQSWKVPALFHWHGLQHDPMQSMAALWIPWVRYQVW